VVTGEGEDAMERTLCHSMAARVRYRGTLAKLCARDIGVSNANVTNTSVVNIEIPRKHNI
jgi:hypothetical protein